MILPFKEQFRDKIISGEKIHTIRKNNKQWTVGKKIYFATGMRTKNYHCFKKGICIGLQEFAIYWRGNTVVVLVSGKTLTLNETETLAKNDGFNSVDDFYKRFIYPNVDYKGIIIHWTNFLY